MTLIDQIRDMIAEGETEKSLDELYTYVKENNADIIDQLVMLRNRNRNLQRSIQMGTMDTQDASLERAKINEAILKLLPQLTPEYLAQASKRMEREPAAAPRSAARPAATAPAAPAQSNLKYYLIGGGAVLLLVILIGVLGGGGDASSATAETAQLSDNVTAATDQTQSSGQSMEPQQTVGTEEAAPDGDLLSQVLATHGGYAIWQPSNGQAYFEVDAERGICQEYTADGTAHASFQVQSVDANYVTLYDASRGMRLRVGESEMLIRHDADNGWKRLYSGSWVTPNQ